MTRQLILVLGGARSGKSDYAEGWAREHGKNVLFVATAEAFDEEMRSRISHHRSTRPADWHTIEAPIQLGATIEAVDQPFDTVVVDCITLLTSNVLLRLPEDVSEQA